MSNVQTVVGLQWGDEGKGKIVDYLSEDASQIARFQGGANAGHTVVVNGQKIVLHQIPSGIVHDDTTCLIGNGVVVDPGTLVEEMETLHEEGIDPEDRLLISPSCHVVLPYHRLLDRSLDALRSDDNDGEEIGTTGRGIGPSHADKVSYWGIRFSDLLQPERFEKRVRMNYRLKGPLLQDILDVEPPDPDELIEEYVSYGQHLSDYVRPVDQKLMEGLNNDRPILLEGAQGTMLDVDLGTYPFVTASNASAAGIYSGTGMPHGSVDNVIVVGKAYTTRVGNGPFPTEDTGEEGQRLREKGNEFGSTTGRPRRCGWFDMVAARYACRVNGADQLAITKLDILSGFDTVKVATEYEIDGSVTEAFPPETHKLEQATPQYTELDGWQEDITECRSYDELPTAAQDFLNFLEDHLDVPVKFIGVGPGRKQTICRSY